MATNHSLLVVGSIALDSVETPFGKRDDALGGSAIYASLAASLFTKVMIVGVAGNDFPEEAIFILKNRNIDIRGLELKKGKTFRWCGKYHKNMNNRDTIYTNLNVFSTFQPKIPNPYKTAPFVFLGNIQPILQLDVLNQVQNPRFVACDTMNLWINTTRNELLQVIQKVDLLLLNDTELAELTDEPNLLKGLSVLHNQGLKTIVVKKGEHGAVLSHKGNLFYAPAVPVKQPTDPTGAGDCFAGGLMGYLSSSSSITFHELKKAVIYGSVLGSYCVEAFSTDGLLNLNHDMITARYRILRRMVSL